MRFLFDLQHPAHLHFFKNIAWRLQEEGHEVLFTGRDKDILIELARQLEIPLTVFGTARGGVVNLGMELLYRQAKLARLIRRFRPDVMMAIAGTFISSLGRAAGIPTYVFYDTEHATISNLLAYPFATCTYVPRCYRKPIRWRHERYNGYHELAYLHPDRFTPDPRVIDELGVSPGERFTLVRLVSWEAAHDVGLAGFTLENKRRAVEELSRLGRVFISSEGTLPAELESYRLKLPVARVHHMMAFASLIFAESATMVSEGAVMGVPGIYVDPVGRGYTDEQERDYGLVSNFTSERQDDAITRAVAIMDGYDREDWQARGRRLVADKIDVHEMLYRIATERPHL